MLLLLLISLTIFPDNSTDFTAYALPMAGGQLGYEITELAIPKDWSNLQRETTKIAVGLVSACATHYLFRKHLSTEHEHAWANTGKGHWLIFRISYSLIKFNID